MARATKAGIRHGYNADAKRWELTAEVEGHLDRTEWEAFERDFNELLRKYPKLRPVKGGSDKG
jgi:hypothetical protein